MSSSCFGERPRAVREAGTSSASLTSASAISVRTDVSSGAVSAARSSGAPSPPGALVSDGGSRTSTRGHATSLRAVAARPVDPGIDFRHREGYSAFEDRSDRHVPSPGVPVDANLSRRLLTEAVGTGLLILFGPGSVVAALALGDGDLDYAALGIIGLSFGLVVALVIYAFGSTSGAHINPAVTVALAATRRFPWREVGPYVAAQLVGAVLGGLLVVAAFGTASVDVSNVGAVSFGPGVGYPRAILVEALGT